MCFGVAKPQYVLLLSMRSAQKKIAPKLDLNPVPLLVSPEPYPVSCGKVLIGLPMLAWLLLPKTKIDRNSKTKAKINIPFLFFHYSLCVHVKLSCKMLPATQIISLPKHFFFHPTTH